MRRRYWIAVSVVAVAIVAAGSAVAATKLESPAARSQAIINDAAGRLHVSPSQLSSALEKAFDDQIDAAVAAGRLTKAQGDALKAQISAGHVPLLGGLGFGLGFRPQLAGPALRFGFGFRLRGLAGPGFRFGLGSPLGAGALLGAGIHVVTRYLGVTPTQLRSELFAGRSLAQIAQEHRKTADGLVTALVSAAKARLDEAVAAKHLSEGQEKAILDKIQPFLETLVNRTPPVLAHLRPGLGLGFGMGLLPGGPFRIGHRPMRPLKRAGVLVPSL
jgi:hypothetical protein